LYTDERHSGRRKRLMILGELQVRSIVKDPVTETMFYVASQDKLKGVTLLLSAQLAGTACFDAAEKNLESDFGKYGNNQYSTSNIRAWLNSEKQSWYTATHEEDTPPDKAHIRYGEQPYLERPGYLTRFSGNFVKKLIPYEIEVLHRYDENEGTVLTLTDRVFLPSRTEIHKGNESGYAEGKMLDLFYDFSVLKAVPTESDRETYGRSWNPPWKWKKQGQYDAPLIYDPKFGWRYWLRTPSLKYGYLVRVMDPSGALTYSYANNDVVGIRPVLSMDREVKVIKGQCGLGINREYILDI